MDAVWGAPLAPRSCPPAHAHVTHSHSRHPCTAPPCASGTAAYWWHRYVGAICRWWCHLQAGVSEVAPWLRCAGGELVGVGECGGAECARWWCHLQADVPQVAPLRTSGTGMRVPFVGGGAIYWGMCGKWHRDEAGGERRSRSEVGARTWRAPTQGPRR